MAWILPTVGLGFVGFGVQIVVTAAAMYVTDAYSKFAGSAIANVAFGENMMAAWLPLATRRMYNVLGFQWASSLLGKSIIQCFSSKANRKYIDDVLQDSLR